VIAVIGLGVAHAIGVSPQMTLINDRCGETVRRSARRRQSVSFGLVERLGTITGPILLSAMIALSGFMSAFVALALVHVCDDDVVHAAAVVVRPRGRPVEIA